MEENKEIVDQKILAEDVSSKINYEMRQFFLVKPLDPIMVEKEFSTPVPKDTEVKDGIEATNYDEVVTEIKTVESDFAQGIVLKIPYEYLEMQKDNRYFMMPINIGDTIIFRNKTKMNFDLLKDSILVDSYAIIAVKR